MSFRRAFTLTGLLLVISLSVMGALALLEQGRVLSAASQGFDAVDRLAQLLSVSEMLERERALVDAIRIAGTEEQPGLRARLHEQRLRTDSTLYVLDEELGASLELTAAVRHEVAELRPGLAKARAALDHALAPSELTANPSLFRPAIGALIALNDPVRRAGDALLSTARQDLPELGESVTGVVNVAAAYRDAGLLRSQLVLAGWTGQFLSPADQELLGQLHGRLAVHREQLQGEAERQRGHSDILAAWQTADHRFFDGALILSQDLEHALAAGGREPSAAGEFLRNYAAGSETLLALRDLELAAVTSDARAALDDVQATQIWLAAATIGAVAALLLGGWLMFGRLLAALDEAVAVVSALAADNLDRSIAMPTGRDEISQLVGGLLGLRGTALERKALERERDGLREELADQANTDRLTGLANLRSFETQAQGHFANNQRHHHPLAVMVFDLDQFRQVNDIYGNAAGDTVLVAIAELCQRMSRASDVAARSGGEEFIVLLPNTTLEGAVVHAERLRASIEGMRVEQRDGAVTRVTASFGVAQCLSTDTDLQDARMRAEVMLLEAKQLGRNRVRYSASRNVPNRESSSSIV